MVLINIFIERLNSRTGQVSKPEVSKPAAGLLIKLLDYVEVEKIWY
jgi:hypothetical protein